MNAPASAPGPSTARSTRAGLLPAVAVVALVLSLFHTLAAVDYQEARGREPDYVEPFVRSLAGWLPWVLLALPLAGASLALWRRSGPWPLALALQLALSGAVAFAHAALDDVVQDELSAMLDDESQRRGSPRGRRDGEGGTPGVARGDPAAGLPQQDGDRAIADDGRLRGPDRAPDAGAPEGSGRRRSGSRSDGRWSSLWTWRRRLPQSLTQYWIVAALGAGLISTRRARAEQRRAVDAELAAARAHAGLAQARLESLRAQVHPHFLFNALHTLGGLIRERRGDEALAALAGLGDLLRAALRHGPDRQETSVDEELELVRLYLELESLRFGERLGHRIEQQDGTGDLSVPCLCLLPLVENAVRYAVEPRADGGRLDISVRRAGGELVLSVHDDGPGFPPEVLAAGGGASIEREQVGLANTAQRLAMLYGDRARLALSNGVGGGARADVHLPLERDPT